MTEADDRPEQFSQLAELVFLKCHLSSLTVDFNEFVKPTLEESTGRLVGAPLPYAEEAYHERLFEVSSAFLVTLESSLEYGERIYESCARRRLTSPEEAELLITVSAHVQRMARAAGALATPALLKLSDRYPEVKQVVANQADRDLAQRIRTEFEFHDFKNLKRNSDLLQQRSEKTFDRASRWCVKQLEHEDEPDEELAGLTAPIVAALQLSRRANQLKEQAIKLERESRLESLRRDLDELSTTLEVIHDGLNVTTKNHRGLLDYLVREAGLDKATSKTIIKSLSLINQLRAEAGNEELAAENLRLLIEEEARLCSELGTVLDAGANLDLPQRVKRRAGLLSPKPQPQVQNALTLAQEHLETVAAGQSVSNFDHDVIAIVRSV